MRVLNSLKPGLDEKICERALALELEASGHFVERQRQFPVKYRNMAVEMPVPDLIVDALVIVDPKVPSGFNDAHIAQMTSYRAITNLQRAILLRFKAAQWDGKRVIRQDVDSPSESVKSA